VALINSDKKFIFFHLFKCAGTSVREILNNNNYFCQEYQGKHSSPRDVKEGLLFDDKPYIFDEYYKITFVRNPFDWLVSIFYYIKNDSENQYHNEVIGLNLNQFIEYYVNCMMLNEGKQIGSNKNTTLFDYVTDKDGKILVDYIGKCETINEDMKNLWGKVDINPKELSLINVGINRERDYRQYYDNKTKTIVEKYFKKDLEFFNYKF